MKPLFLLLLFCSCLPSPQKTIERQRDEIREQRVIIILREAEIEHLKKEVEFWKADNET
jgi:hypothetical protein